MSLQIHSLWPQLPLAEAFWLFLQETWSPNDLNTFYDQHRGRAYQSKITFPELVDFLLHALASKKGRLYPILQTKPELPASIQAIYAKIQRMPRTLSEAFVAWDAQRLREACPHLAYPDPNAKGLAKFHQFVFDGHMLKRASKRLKDTRQTPGRALGGKILTALHRQSDLVAGLSSSAHAHVNEQALLPDLLKQVREHWSGPRLWIGDRAFGNLANFKGCTEAGDHGLIRKTSQSVFTPDPSQTIHGRDRLGRGYWDEIGVLSSKREGEQAVRQITVERVGLKPLVIITSLLDQEEYPTEDLLALYRERWSIERKYQKVSQLFHLGPYVGSHPDGILFQVALTVGLSNNLTVLQALMAQEQNRAVETISTQRLLERLQEELVVCKTLMEPESLIASLQDRLVASGGNWLDRVKELVRLGWRKEMVKSPAKKRHLPKVKHRRGAAGHISIHKVLEEAKAKRQKQTVPKAKKTKVT